VVSGHSYSIMYSFALACYAFNNINTGSSNGSVRLPDDHFVTYQSFCHISKSSDELGMLTIIVWWLLTSAFRLIVLQHIGPTLCRRRCLHLWCSLDFNCSLYFFSFHSRNPLSVSKLVVILVTCIVTDNLFCGTWQWMMILCNKMLLNLWPY